MSILTDGSLNYFKLDQVIGRSCILLRQLFKTRYSLLKHGKTWDDSPACGSSFFLSTVSKNNTMNLTSVQRAAVMHGDSNEWDLTTLTSLLLNTDYPTSLNKTIKQQIDTENKLLKQLRDIRNALAHHSSKSIDTTEFNRLWADLTKILVALGGNESELDKLKDDRFSDTSSQCINEENVQQALQFNSLGTKAHKEGNYSEAITHFTKATVLPGVKDQDRAIFYSNLSASRLALHETKSKTSTRLNIEDYHDERYRALQDAKQARNLWSTWWKGHFRVGKVYVAMNENEKAISSLERALALAPGNDEVQQTLYDVRQIHGRQARQEHLDPRLQPRTVPEQLYEMKEKLGLDPQQVRKAHVMLEKMNPSGADVVKGHKYEHGDIDTKQDYEQAARYFAKAARQGNAEGMYNLARLTDLGLGVKKDHQAALRLFEQTAAQPYEDPILKGMPNIGVAEAEHSLGLRYTEGVSVHRNLLTAAYWYQRATDHGSANSANNLALMYQGGIGVERDLKKAEQLFELSSRRGDPNAMLNLANLLLDKRDFQMAKIWYDRACESGNIMAQSNRLNFENALNQKKAVFDSFSPDDLHKIEVVKKFVEKIRAPPSIYTQTVRPYLHYYNVLDEFARRGSVTAQRLCDALQHFCKALYVLKEIDSPTEEEENIFIVELAECYRIEHIVAQFPGVESRQKAEKIIDRALTRTHVDEDARICFAVFHLDSFELAECFLKEAKLKYSKSVCFYEFSSSVNGWLKNYEAALYDANLGLQIEPDYYELLYYKAVALRLIGRDCSETIAAYKEFLSKAPKDHRKVPESYYAIARCHFSPNMTGDTEEKIRQIFKDGLEAEKIQLPCFLPYESTSKTFMLPVYDLASFVNNQPTSVPDRKAVLSNPHRIEIIKRHRKWQASIPEISSILDTQKPRLKQTVPKSLIGLKPITLREMDPNKDHVYDGYVLSLIIIDEALNWAPSIHLVVEDEHRDCESMCIYGFPEKQGAQLISQVFTIGSKMNVINPYLRIGANDMKPMIRVDNFSSIIMQNESERVPHMCRCCGEANAAHVCSKCKRARYCSKDCQTLDWKVFEHKLICGKNMTF